MSRVVHAVSAAPVVTRRAVGTSAEVAAAVARVRRSGRLLAMSTPRQLADGRYYADVTFLPPPRHARAIGPRRSRRRVAGIVTAVLLGLIAVAGVSWWLLTVLVAALAPYAAAALAVLALWVIASARRGHPCRGLHCGGCTG